MNMKHGIASQVTGSYPLFVNYDLSVEDAVKLGRYDWANSDITSEHFPTTRTGKIKVVVRLIHFDRNILVKDALRGPDKKGFRPATLEELLAFGAKYPEMQRQFLIVALGPFWQSITVRFVPYLWRHSHERFLGLCWFEYGWGDYCRFLAVRNK